MLYAEGAFYNIF